MELTSLPAHRHAYVKIGQLKAYLPRLLTAADTLTGHERTFGMEHRVKVWESDVPNRVEAKLLFVKTFADREEQTLCYCLYGIARATTDLWDLLTAFRSYLGDPMHVELTHRETLTSDHPFPYEDDWLGFQVWWPLDDWKHTGLVGHWS